MMRWTKGKKGAEQAPRPGGPISTVSGVSSSEVSAPPSVVDGSEPVEPQKTLPELLLSQGKITREQLEQALVRQKETGQFIGEILIEQGTIDENSLISFLAKYCKIPHLSLLDYLIDQSIVGVIPEEVCLKYRLIPIDKIGRNLTVAMVNPLNTEALEAVRKLCPDLRIKPILCAYNHFEVVTSRLFSKSRKGGPMELSATSLGLSVRITPKAPAPVPAAAPVVPHVSAETVPVSAPEEYIPDAMEVYPEAEEHVSDPEPPDSVSHSVLEGPVREREAVLTEVFHAGPAPSGPAMALTESDTEESALMKEMASVMMDSMRDTYAMLARRMELFRGLSPEDVARIFARGVSNEYAPGQVIFEKGQPASEMYVILGGEVEIYDGDRVLAVLRRGDMFGEMAVVSGQPRSAGARASEMTSALALSVDIINHVLPGDVAVKVLTNIVITLSMRLRRANEAWISPETK